MPVYEKTIQAFAHAGQSNHIPVPFPHRGRISKLLVKQLTGVDAGFRLDLYNSRQPMDEASQSSQSAETAEIDPLAFQIIPTQEIAAGNLEMFMENGNDYEYRNVDGSYSVPQRFVYVRLEPYGTGSKEFQITIAGVPPDL